MFRLAHLSDVHLGPLPQLSLRELASKRVTGWYNWQRNRRRMMFGDTLSDLVQDLKEENPDHIAVTGDLVNLATKKETVASGIWLRDLGPPRDVSLIPGNHDAYVPGALKRSYREWYPYMIGDEPLQASDSSFPYLRIRENVAILGVSTAEATAPFFATGTFKRGQALRLAKLLETTHALGLFRVVMIHHPPIPGSTSWHKRLIGKQFFSKVMREIGAELVLHGHTHLDTLNWLNGPDRQIPVVGVPSASQAPGGDNPASRYNLFEISGGPATWTLIQRERGAREDGKGIAWIRERELLADGRAIDARPREDAKPADEPAG